MGTQRRIVRERVRQTATRSGLVLSREVITDAALRLIAEHGSDALSVRRLGAALEASPTAIYRHFTDMDDLVLEVADRLIGVSLEGFERGPDWREDLRELAHRVHRVYLEQPRVAALVAARTTGRVNESRIIEVLLAVIGSAGFDDAETVSVYRAYADLVLAFSGIDAAFSALPQPIGDADRARWEADHALVSPTTHPTLTRLASLLAEQAGTSAFETALELFLDGVEGHLERKRRSARGRPTDPRSAD
ncbi:TetR/AcrR family transcriptional regulator [Kitasatospora paranensis]|uniref:TetR/AcrR family transcriptional regulator n=1 Tax=Kitasatospora paranensis TaxID=258053 RepID=A0ABW2G1S0_9ACTN